MPKILYPVTGFFVSHFLPMAQAARDCGLQVVVATRVRDGGERLKAEGFFVIAIESRRGRFSPLRSLRDFFAIVGSWFRSLRTRYLFENRDDPREFGLGPDGADVTIVGGAGVDPENFHAATSWGAAADGRVVARMIRPKGVVESVAAVQRVRAAGAPLELRLFGAPDPDNPRSLPQATLAQWSQAPGITWHGHEADVARVWREHHVAMLLSYREDLRAMLH